MHKGFTYHIKQWFLHRSFGQLLLSGVMMCVLVGASAGSGVAFASVLQTNADAVQPTPMPSPTPIVTPAPTPNAQWLSANWHQSSVGAPATPVPDIEVQMSLGGSQQKLSVGIYTTKMDENGYTWDEVIIGLPVEITIVCDSLTKLKDKENDTEHQASVVGAISKYELNTKTGTFQLPDINPGTYTVSIACSVDGYLMPEKAQIEVREKVSTTVKDDLEMEEGQAGDKEDSSNETVKPSEKPKDTVPFVNPSVKEVKLSAYWYQDGSFWTSNAGGIYLYFADGSRSPYQLKTAKTKTEAEYLVSATLDLAMVGSSELQTTAVTPARAASGASRLSLSPTRAGGALSLMQLQTGVTDVPNANATPEVTVSAAPTPTETPVPTAAPTPEPTAVATSAPTAPPSTEPTATAAPTATQSPVASATPVPTPTATLAPTVTPSATPIPTVTPTPTPTYDVLSYLFFENGAVVTTAQSVFLLPSVTEKVAEATYSGWWTLEGKTYYFHPETNKPVTGAQIINGTSYLFGANGIYNAPKCMGIDVSYHQGEIDFAKVAASGVEFVIIRAGYRGYGTGVIKEDVRAAQYIAAAKAAGLRVGIYFFSQAINAEEGVEEASACVNFIKKYGTSYPIYIDTELSGTWDNRGRADGISNEDRTEAVVAFCETVESAGYTAGIYASYSWFYNKLNFSEISGYSLWNAQWGTTNSMPYAGMWQYSATGAVNGIQTNVDLNVSYIG